MNFARNHSAGPARLTWTLLAAFAVPLVLGPSVVRARSGDITINASSQAEVDCADCLPSGKGRQLCYEVTLARNAEHVPARDFHIQVNSANTNLFRCFTIESQGPDGVMRKEAGWSGRAESQVENNTNRHYISWFKTDPDAGQLGWGSTMRFCVVYCGDDSNLDDSLEFIVTDSGDALPGVPGTDGTRADVPDSAVGVDDPGWTGVKTNAAGSKTGFLLSVAVIPPGIDLFQTINNGGTAIDFSTDALAAGFFGPGSEPFTNRVDLVGVPVDPAAGVTGQAEMILLRPAATAVPLGGSVNVPVQLVALSLQSAEPIQVSYPGRAPELWSMKVACSPVGLPLSGTMTISAGGDGWGGSATGVVSYRPRFTFTRVSDRRTRILDFSQRPGQPVLELEFGRTSWSAIDPDLTPLVTAPAGIWVDHDGIAGTRPLGPLPESSMGFRLAARTTVCASVPPAPGFSDTGFMTLPSLMSAHADAASGGANALNGVALSGRPYLSLSAFPAATLPLRNLPGDLDGDGVPDLIDNAVVAFNPGQEDRDADGVGDVVDISPDRSNPCQDVDPAVPQIVDPPQSLTAMSGTPVVFVVVAVGAPPLDYQWWHNGTELKDQNGPALLLPAVTSADAGSYTVAVRNPAGTVTAGPAELVVISENQPPQFGPLASRTVHAGAGIILPVTVIDPDPGQTVTVTLGAGSPAAAVFDPLVGEVRWAPGVGELGTHTFTLVAVDNGVPSMYATATFDVTVVPPPVVQGIYREGNSVRLVWNSIPGQDYQIRSSRSLEPSGWAYRATVTADAEMATWTDMLGAEAGAQFFQVAVLQEGICTCESMTFDYLDRHLPQVTFTTASGATPGSVEVDIPFTLVGTITCRRGGGHCAGKITAELKSGTWQYVWVTNGVGVAAQINASGKLGPFDPLVKVKDPDTVHGTCGETSDYSAAGRYLEKVSFNGKNDERKDLKSGKIRLEGILKFDVKWGCTLPGSSRTITVAVSSDAAFAATNGFDTTKSDFDGDGRVGGGPNPDRDDEDFRRQ